MTSTFPTTRSNGLNLKYGIRELQHKKQTLLNLEAALKTRINEFRQLCMKEGELTGHLPADYPLQPREPIPQVRRRITRSNGSIPSELHTPSSSRLDLQPMRPPRTAHSHTNPHFNNQPNQLARASPLSGRDSSSNSTNGSVSNMTESPTPSKPRLEDPAINLRNLSHDVTNFQPYYEETKPFQMSDFYKYSAKHRQQTTTTQSQKMNLPPIISRPRTTRQLQDEVATMKKPLKLTAYDDQIQASRKLFEESGQRFQNATARAIACNPSLADRINNIIPNHQSEGY